MRLFLRARAVIKFVLRASSPVENTDGEQRALRKFSASQKIQMASSEHFVSFPLARISL